MQFKKIKNCKNVLFLPEWKSFASVQQVSTLNLDFNIYVLRIYSLLCFLLKFDFHKFSEDEYNKILSILTSCIWRFVFNFVIFFFPQ